MSLHDKALALTHERRKRHKRCRLGQFREGLDEAAQADLDEAIADREIGQKELSSVLLEEYGVDINYQSIGRHRSGDCKSCNGDG